MGDFFGAMFFFFVIFPLGYIDFNFYFVDEILALILYLFTFCGIFGHFIFGILYFIARVFSLKRLQKFSKYLFFISLVCACLLLALYLSKPNTVKIVPMTNLPIILAAILFRCALIHCNLIIHTSKNPRDKKMITYGHDYYNKYYGDK